MIKRFSPFLWAGPIQALAESFLLSFLWLAGLVWVSSEVPLQVIIQGVFFTSLSGAFWCTLRLRRYQGRRRSKLMRWGSIGLSLSVLLGLVLSLIAAVFNWDDVFAAAGLESLNVIVILLASGPAFMGFRAGLWLWWYWDRLRRKHLIWSLTHAHLILVVLLVAAYVLVATAEIFYGLTFEFDPMPGRLITDNVAAMIADRIMRTFFPVVGLAAVLTILALMIVLPPSAVISFFVSRKTTRRLATLANTTRAMREGDYSARVTVIGEDEVAQLQSDFNAMAEKLQQILQDLETERDTVSRLLQSRRELVASVSHELRTPVATVRATLESVLHKQADLSASLWHDLEVMENETLRLQRLIDDLFTLSQAEVEKLTLDCQSTAVPPVVRQIVEAMAPLAWNAGRVEVVTELPDDLPAICIDKIRFEQILVNLLRNAIRHTPPGGIVAVMGRLEAGAEANTVCLEVRDTGNGINPDDLPHIWERFYRAKDADASGAGLGLALVKELTEAMGGRVSVKSTSGRGSCFTVRFPIA